MSQGWGIVVNMGVELSNGRAADTLSGHRVQVLLPSAPLEGATLAGLKERMRSASRAEAKVAAVRAEAAAEYSRRMGHKAAERTLREQSGKSSRGSRTEVEVANKLKGLPDTSKAFEDGQISYRHARIIVKTSEEVEIDERELVDRAKKEPVDVFARSARKHEQERSQDDGLSKLERQRKKRGARIKTDPDDGMVVLYGRFDPVTGARVKNALSRKTNELWRAEDAKNRPTTAQRMADAVAELLCQPGKGKGKSRGATLFLVANYDTGTQTIRDATLADGTPIPVAVFQDMACQGKIVPAVFDTRGRPLWVGMSRRLATPAQRMTLIARDRGCVGCGADPAWCQAHHLISWEAGGPTDIDNLCLLCSRCHHQVHDDGWQIRQTPAGKHVLQPPHPTNRSPLPIKTPPRRRGRYKPTTKLIL